MNSQNYILATPKYTHKWDAFGEGQFVVTCNAPNWFRRWASTWLLGSIWTPLEG